MEAMNQAALLDQDGNTPVGCPSCNATGGLSISHVGKSKFISFTCRHRGTLPQRGKLEVSRDMSSEAIIEWVKRELERHHA